MGDLHPEGDLMMIMIAAATRRWTIENGRSIGVAAATVCVLFFRVRGEAQLDPLGLLAIILPALEVVMFAVVFAFYLDGEDGARGATCGRGVEAMIAWFVAVALVMWGNIALVRLGIEAYVRLGVPPRWDVPL
jgi:hypothetical protein